MVLVLVGAGCDPELIEHPETATDGSTEASAEASFPADVATAYCAALFACGGPGACSPEHELPYADEPGCVAHEQARLEELRTNASAAGLVFDADCVDAVISAYSSFGCLSLGQATLHVPEQTNLALGCQPYVGSVPVHDGTCITVAGTALSDCEAGTSCDDGTCRPIDGPAPCVTECAPGTTCADYPFDRYICAEIVGAGETCVQDGERVAYCAPGTGCQLQASEGFTVGLCAVQVGVGEACTSNQDCDTFVCTEGVCEAVAPLLCGYAPRHWRSTQG